MKTSLKNRWFILLGIALVIMAAGIALDSVFFSAYRLNLRYETVSGSRIPSSHNGMSIVCFGDLEYGTYMDKKRMTNLVETVNRLSPDTIVFLGDLYDRAYTPTEEEEAEFVKLLSTLRAPEGKFAVLGEMDRARSEAIVKDLTSAGFEVLENEAIQIHHGANEYIDLVGFNVNTVDQYTVSSMYAGLESEVFKIVVSHSADIADNLPVASTDWVIGANAHSYQTRFPLFESFVKDETSNRYTPGKHIVDNTVIYASYGVGTTKNDRRLFADPEILVLKLSPSK